MNKLDKGYYSTEQVEFEDHHAGHLEKGFVIRFLLFIDKNRFLCTNWKNKDVLNFGDISRIERGGGYVVKGSKIYLTYEPGGWKEECTIINKDTIQYHFSERIMTYRKWGTKN